MTVVALPGDTQPSLFLEHFTVNNSCSSKVVLIIDDPVKYVLVQEAIKGTVVLPQIYDMTMSNRYFFLLYKDGIFECHKYKNSRKGYNEIVRFSYNDISPLR